MRDQGLQILGSHEAILNFERLDDHNYDVGLSGPHELDCYCCGAQGQWIADGLSETIGQPPSTVAKSGLSTASQYR